MRRLVIAAAFGLPLLVGGVLLAQSKILAPAAPQMTAGTVAPSGASPAQSGIQTVKLKVDGMWCPSCGYIVGQALKKTPGVIDAKVSMRAGSAVVTYDNSRTDVATLIAATTDYGYPSRLYSSAI